MFECDKPDYVCFILNKEEAEQKITKYLEETINEKLSISITLDEDFIDLFEITLEEEENANAFQKLMEKGYDTEDMEQFKQQVFARMLGTTHFFTCAYMKTNYDDFDIRVFIAFEAFFEDRKGTLEGRF